MFAGKELVIARAAKVTVIRQITEGGILAGLWELSKETDMGLDLDMKKMSVLQETIEVCEHFRMNPYQLASAGSFLMLTEDGRKLADAMRENLDRPASDEIYKLFI